MKYQNLKAFQKHLISSTPHHLCRSYFVAIQDDFERMKAIHLILSYFSAATIRFQGSDFQLESLLEAMQSMSLFGESIVFLDEVEKLSKKQLEIVAHSLESSEGITLFGTRSKTALLAAAVEKKGVVLDLLEEKSWEREKRISEELMERVKNRGKKLSSDVPFLLFERLGADLALLENEIDKLISYVGERSFITKEDVFAISFASKALNVWQIAEEIIWEAKEFPLLEASLFHSLLPALRHQLHLGLSLACLIEEGRPSDQWGAYLPKIWPKTLEKRSSQAARFGSSYFQKKLHKLFDLEFLSRSNATHYQALLDLFKA